MNSSSLRLLFLGILITLVGCKKDTKWVGQKPIQVVPTNTVPIQKQYKDTFNLGEGIYATNNFEGARLNGIALTNDTITALITPENTPINPSPWYAFKLWAEEEQDIHLKLTYLDGVYHRYYPKLSRDGINWKNLDSLNYTPGERSAINEVTSLPKYVTMSLSIGPDTLWVSAQELVTSSHAKAWIEELKAKPYVTHTEIGKSKEGRSMDLLKIGNSNDKKMIFVLSRQHPPEVTGYLAMTSFVEAIASDNPLAVEFREEFNTYVVPMANPDGVDNGHWRHSAAGIDLNRDWENVNQPEVAAIQQFMKNKLTTSGGAFYFGVDFHSTWQDIYYTIDPELEGNMPGLVPTMIDSMARQLNLDPNIRPGEVTNITISSSKYFFEQFGAESLTYEIGDNTPRELLKKKGEVSALELMEILLLK